MDTVDNKNSPKKRVFSYLLMEEEALLVELLRQNRDEMHESLDVVFRLATFDRSDLWAEEKDHLHNLYDLKELFAGNAKFLNMFREIKLPIPPEDGNQTA
jgi:hypothetical protein